MSDKSTFTVGGYAVFIISDLTKILDSNTVS